MLLYISCYIYSYCNLKKVETHTHTLTHSLIFVLCEQDLSLSVHSCNTIWENIQFQCDRGELGRQGSKQTAVIAALP